MAFAGTRWGSVSYGKSYPETLYKKAISPRLGIAFSLNPKTVIRTGYGIFYDAAITPGWNGGMDTTGFNLWKSFGNSQGGLAPAFILSQGLPTDYQKPPILDPSFVNGQGPAVYRPLDGNRLPYSQTWSLSLEREFTEDFYISAAYVGTKGTRLYSRTAPINVLDPELGIHNHENVNPQFAVFLPGGWEKPRRLLWSRPEIISKNNLHNFVPELNADHTDLWKRDFLVPLPTIHRGDAASPDPWRRDRLVPLPTIRRGGAASLVAP